MKKIILTAIVLSSTLMFSQEIKFGAKVGLNVSNLRGNYPKEIDENNSIIGFHLGGFVEYKINDKFKLQPELLISTQGGSAVRNLSENGGRTTFGSFTQTPKLTYLIIPIMFKYQIIDKLHIEFGPQIGYLVSAKSVWEGKIFDDPSENFSLEVDLLNAGTYNIDGTTFKADPKTNRFDYGLNIGASYDITDKIIVQVRYNLGLSSIDDNSTYGSDTSSWELKNSVLQFSTCYKF